MGERTLVKKALRIVIHVPQRFEDASYKKGWIRQLEYSYLIGRVVTKGDPLSLGSLATTVWDTTPSGEVRITEKTEIEVEELPYLEWEEGGSHYGGFEDYNKWMMNLKKKYGVRETQGERGCYERALIKREKTIGRI